MMKTKILAAWSALILLSTTSLSAQVIETESELHSGVQVTLLPPLSTNGRHAARYTNDFSLNLLVGVSKSERVLTIGGLTNVILEDAYGFQLAGLANYTGGHGCGVQIGGLANIVRDEYKGFQFTGLVDEYKGFQLGMFNVAGDVDGFQFAGLFNKVRNIKGVQFAGILNIAESSDYPIGLINIIQEGEMSIAVGYNEIGTTSLTFRSGGRVTYGILGMGYNHHVGRTEDAFSVMAGYGAHINILPWLRLNNELTIEQINIFEKRHDTFKAGYALLPAFRSGRFELFGGPSINYMRSNNERMHDLFQKNPFWEKKYESGKWKQLFIGWQVGVQVLF